MADILPVILDDTAILKTEEGFVRPSDIVDSKYVRLLALQNNVKNKVYVDCKISKVRSAYATLRFSHGPMMNIGLDCIMLGMRGTGKWAKTSKDLVKLIQFKFKYGYNEPLDLYEGYEDEYYIDLSEIGMEGQYNIATEDFFRMLGFFTRRGIMAKNKKEIAFKIVRENAEFYEDLLRRLEIGFRYSNESRTFIRIENKGVVVKLLVLLAGETLPHTADDEVCLKCGPKLANAFREGFIKCGCNDKPLASKEVELRHSFVGTFFTLSDLAFLWNKAGYNVIATKRTNNIAIAEGRTRWANYIQSVEHSNGLKEMYSIEPMNREAFGLWVHGVRFLCMNK